MRVKVGSMLKISLGDMHGKNLQKMSLVIQIKNFSYNWQNGKNPNQDTAPLQPLARKAV
jgi:hypothetical protein